MRSDLQRFIFSMSMVGWLCGSLGGVLLGSGCSSRHSTPVAVQSPATNSARALGRSRTALPRTTREPQRPLSRVAADRLLVAVAPPPGRRPVAPLSLTASDGTGLALSALQASVVVSGPLGFTELHLTFDNPEDRVLEGRFEITLPPGAAISRFAMRMNDGWREAEVVERQRARVAYEDFLHRRQDPALLEREAGNQFSARVFPIPARGRKELKISYSQELREAAHPYRLPLCGLPRLGRLEILAIAGDEVTQVIKQDLVPDQDFEIRPPPRSVASSAGLRSDRLAVARIRIGGERTPSAMAAEQYLENVLVLVDTSASRAAGFAQQLDLVSGLVDSMRQTRPQATVQLAAFDQGVAPLFSGPIGDLTPQKLMALGQRGPLGASDLEGALRFAKSATGATRIVLITDGIATAQGGPGEQRAAAAALAPTIQRLDVILVGGIRDEVAMRGLAAALPQPGLVLDGTLPAARLVERLWQPVLADLKVAVAGTRWHWPTVLDGVQPGDERLVFAELDEGEPGQSLRVHLSGVPGAASDVVSEIPLQGASAPLLERAYVQARLAALSHEHGQLVATDKQAAAALRADIIELSTRHRVLSDFTALLVLDTEQDYARNHIDRRALSDILTVGDRGIELLQRGGKPDPALMAGSPPSSASRKDPSRVLDKTQRYAIRGPAPETFEPALRDPAVAADVEEDKEPAETRNAEAAKAREVGVLGILRQQPGQGPASIFGRDSALGGSGAEDSLGGLVGAEIGDAYGSGGLGLVGTGRGGGGSGEGTIGLGNLGTIGRGSGRSDSYGARATGRRTAPGVVPGVAEVRGALDRELVRRIIRRHINEVKFCYERELTRNPRIEGRVMIQFTIAPTGDVPQSSVQSSTLGSIPVEQCIASAVRRWEFPRPLGGGIVLVTYPFLLRPEEEASPPAMQPDTEDDRSEEEAKSPSVPAYTGTMLEVMTQLGRGRVPEALQVARTWRQREPGDVLALTALGAALSASGNIAEAERAFGSIVDLYPSRADLRRYAGARLEALRSTPTGLRLATDTYKKAVEQRPDHPSSHRLYAFALSRLGQHAEAFAALRAGLNQRYPNGRFLGVEQVLRDDLGILAAAWRRAEPARAGEIQRELDLAGVAWASQPSLRFVLTWETDANDVDFHIHDGQRGHAYFARQALPSGGTLYADVTTGYGPECFAINGRPAAFPYRLEAHYYSRGPMGYGMGKLQILQHDGKGGLRFADRPFVVMNDGAYVDLGRLAKPL